MTELSSKILQDFQVRKSKKQKDAFIQLLTASIPDLQIQESPIIKSRNLIVGDISKAKAVLTAHYDTCAKLPFPNFITPMNPLLAIGYSILLVIPMFLVIMLVNLLLRLTGAGFWVYYSISLFLLLGMMVLMIAGPANRHTANDNTSGIITLLEIYLSMTDEERQQTAFVFFDNEEAGLLGSSYFNKKYKQTMKNRLLINFDCVSDGDNFLIAASKKAKQCCSDTLIAAYFDSNGKKALHKKLESVYYPSDQAGFPVSIAVAALKHKKFVGYYMNRIHTSRDTVFMEENITYLVSGTRQLLKNL